MYAMTNKRECQMGVNSRLRDSNAETAKDWYWNIGTAYRKCRNMVTKKTAEANRLRGAKNVMGQCGMLNLMRWLTRTGRQ